ncbi:hypothetical protein AB1Y20_007890 [Prymnesium parvum]|uniref:Uncharacterized protein n=1 Tax=Prymnesium parvum TaxID=97485 RepID=A0AB34IUS2_PRYPA
MRGAAMRALSAVIFVALSRAAEDRSFRSLCFPKENLDAIIAKRTSAVFGRSSRRGSRVIKIEVRSWDSHEITTRIAEILLREKLGMDVEVLSFDADDRANRISTATEVYARLDRGASNNGVDLNFELWPEEPGPKAARQLALEGDARYASLTKYVGRNSWFIPIQSIRDDVDWALVNEGQVVEVSNPGYDAWRGFFPLYQFANLHRSMIAAKDLPEVPSACDILSDEAYIASRTPLVGKYNCELGTWYPTDGRCCPRHEEPCNGIDPCRVLVVNTPNFAPNRNELAVNASGLPLQILYVREFSTVLQFVNESIASKQPLILQWWEPSWMIPPGEFLRFDMTPHFYCEDGGSQSNTYLPENPTCDFPGQSLEKMANADLETAEPQAWSFSQKLGVSFDDIYVMAERTTNETWAQQEAISTLRAENPNLRNISHLYWQTACEFLREQQGCSSRSGELEICWENWVDTSQDIPFELVDVLFFIATTLLVVVVSTVILRGDDGYTTGYPGLSPIDFLYKACAWFTKKKVRVRQSVASATRFNVSTPPQLPTSLRKQQSMFTNSLIASACDEPTSTCITFGRVKILVSNQADYVAVPVLRLGNSEGALDFTIESADGIIGVPAKYGREYGKMKCPHEVKHAGQQRNPHQINVQFPPKTRMTFIYVELKHPEGMVTEYNGFADFFLTLHHSSTALIGPLAAVCIEIVDVEAFPDERNAKRLKELTEHKSKDGGVIKRPSSMKDLFADSHIYSHPTVKVQANIRERLHLVFGFLVRITRVNGVRRKVVKHQIVSVLIAVHDCFLVPYMYRQILSYGVVEKRIDITLSIALLMLALYACKYYIRLNFFHGSFLIVQHLRSLLCRKYLTLSVQDRARLHINEAAVQEAYRVAFVFTCEEIREMCYKSVFHHGLPNLYGVISSMAFISYTIFAGRSSGEVSGETTTAVMLMSFGLLVIVTLLYSARARLSVLIWRAEFLLSRKFETELQHLLQEWKNIRDTSSAQKKSATLIGTYWKYIREGQYRMWYHRFYTQWGFEHFRTFFMYGLWAFAPFFNSSAEFVPLITVIQSLGDSAQNLAENFLDLLTSSQQVSEVAALLNEDGEVMKRARRECLKGDAPRQHAKFAVELDKALFGSESRVWEMTESSDSLDFANQDDARTSAMQIVQSVASGNIVSLDSNTFDEVVSLFKAWSSLLSGTEGKGFLLIRDVYCSLPAPTGEIFRGLCVADMLPQQMMGRISHDAHTERRVFKELPHRLSPEGPRECPICTHLPADSIIGLRSSLNSAHHRVALRVLLTMWNGRFYPDKGSCHCLLRCELVAETEAKLGAETLIENLLHASGNDFFDMLTEDSDSQGCVDPLVRDRFMYQLCRQVGVSASLIGPEPSKGKGWPIGHQPLSLLIDKEDVIKILLVRAVLAQPDALLLDSVCEGLCPESQRQIFDFTRAHLRGELTDLFCEEAGIQPHRHDSRSVIFLASDSTLALGLTDSDPVLTVLSPTEAMLCLKNDALPSSNDIIDHWLAAHSSSPSASNEIPRAGGTTKWNGDEAEDSTGRKEIIASPNGKSNGGSVERQSTRSSRVQWGLRSDSRPSRPSQSNGNDMDAIQLHENSSV